MMPYMCDSLLPVEQRYASPKFRRLSRWFNPYRQSRGDLIEVRAMMLTPGFLNEHVFLLMHWDKNMGANLRVLEQLDEEARPYALANAMGVDQGDGEAILRALIEARPSFSRSAPLWVTRMLQERRKRGHTAAQIAKDYGVRVDQVRRWWKNDNFDPLTGLRRPAGALRTRRMLGI